MKWIGVAALVLVGLISAFFAIEYFTVQIHALPSFVPGHGPAYAHGHYTKRGIAAAVVAGVCFVAAAVLAVRFQRQSSTPADKSAGDLLSGGATPPVPPAGE